MTEVKAVCWKMQNIDMLQYTPNYQHFSTKNYSTLPMLAMQKYLPLQMLYAYAYDNIMVIIIVSIWIWEWRGLYQC